MISIVVLFDQETNMKTTHVKPATGKYVKPMTPTSRILGREAVAQPKVAEPGSRY